MSCKGSNFGCRAPCKCSVAFVSWNAKSVVAACQANKRQHPDEQVDDVLCNQPRNKAGSVQTWACTMGTLVNTGNIPRNAGSVSGTIAGNLEVHAKTGLLHWTSCQPMHFADMQKFVHVCHVCACIYGISMCMTRNLATNQLDATCKYLGVEV